MLPIKDLLNPVPAETDYYTSCEDNSSASASPAAGLQSTVATSPELSPPPRRLGRCSNSSSVPQEPVSYQPYQVFDPDMQQLLKTYKIWSTADIGKTCDHIPYNSSKKDLFHKTGRDSLEVFQYDFYYGKDVTKYTVMWDYSAGLVRITPFFKSLGFSKTKPSQVLDKNPGLRDVCPSITGGSVSAQGYWMPYSCAREICATFCYRIAPALIPLFGPSFPSQCIHPTAQAFEQMRVSPNTIKEAAAEMYRFRDLQMKTKAYQQKETFSVSQSPYDSRDHVVDRSPRRHSREHSARTSSVWTAINTAVNSTSLPVLSSSRASNRRLLVDQRPRAMRSVEQGRLDSIHNIQSSSHSVRLPPIDARRSFTDIYSPKRRRTEKNTGPMSMISLGEENRPHAPKRGAELHAASALVGMHRGPGNPLDKPHASRRY